METNLLRKGKHMILIFSERTISINNIGHTNVEGCQLFSPPYTSYPHVKLPVMHGYWEYVIRILYIYSFVNRNNRIYCYQFIVHTIVQYSACIWIYMHTVCG